MKKEELIKLLKPYWKKSLKIELKYIKKYSKLEDKMNKRLKKYKLPELEFFRVDSEVVGIGAANYGDRKKFHLIQEDELGGLFNE